jgi:hypothetical protein
MRRNANYKHEPMGELELVEDFLPPPDRLVLNEDGVMVTISLRKHSVRQDQRSRIKKDPQISRTPMQLTMQRG